MDKLVIAPSSHEYAVQGVVPLLVLDLVEVLSYAVATAVFGRASDYIYRRANVQITLDEATMASKLVWPSVTNDIRKEK